MKRHVLVLTLVIAALSIGLAGCGSSDSTTTMTDTATTTEATTDAAATTAAATTDTSMVTTGSAVCDKASLTKAAMEADPTIVSVMTGPCVDGWTVVGANTSEYTYTMVFEAEGEFWVYKKGVDCTTIPKELQAACETN